MPKKPTPQKLICPPARHRVYTMTTPIHTQIKQILIWNELCAQPKKIRFNVDMFMDLYLRKTFTEKQVSAIENTIKKWHIASYFTKKNINLEDYEIEIEKETAPVCLIRL
jgi:hypothetical protein